VNPAAGAFRYFLTQIGLIAALPRFVYLGPDAPVA
jgi:hypothetical protein